MPAGVPNLSSFLESFSANLSAALIYFEVPAFEEVRNHATAALNDSITASKSTYAFFNLTCKPLLILISLISHYLYIVLKILAECTVQHGFIALKEAWRQTSFACRWFVQFQKGLSRTAIMIELGVLCLLVVLYVIRRHIKKKRYVERVINWYKRKRDAIQLKYYNFVDSVSQTSMFLALLLPHCLFICVVSFLWYFIPSVIRYFATKTFFTTLITIYSPFVKTVLAAHRWRGIVLKEKRNRESNNRTDKADKALSRSTSRSCNNIGKNESAKGGFFSSFRSNRKAVSEKYLKTANPGNNKPDVSNNKSRKPKTSPEIERLKEDFATEIAELLKYWAVYSCLSAIFHIFTYLPIVGRIFPDPYTLQTQAQGKRWAKTSQSWFRKLKFSREFTDEIKMFFYIWLLYLPTSIKRSTTSSTTKPTQLQSVKSKVSAFEKKATQAKVQPRRQKKIESMSNRPLDIIYERLSPLAIALVETSASLSQSQSSDNSKVSIAQSTTQRAISWCRSFLDVMMWTGLISEKTKKRIIAFSTECATLLPALVTLFMPSYFTRYGIIFIRLVVPAANSSVTLNSICKHNGKKKNDDADLTPILCTGVRYLQYWVIQCIVKSTFQSFSPVLNWIPFSTHLQWIVWSILQMETPTSRIYSIFEKELTLFGLLEVHEKFERQELDINKSLSARAFHSLLKKLPSGINTDSIKEKDVSNTDSSIEMDTKKSETTEPKTATVISSTIDDEKKEKKLVTEINGINEANINNDTNGWIASKAKFNAEKSNSESDTKQVSQSDAAVATDVELISKTNGKAKVNTEDNESIPITTSISDEIGNERKGDVVKEIVEK